MWEIYRRMWNQQETHYIITNNYFTKKKWFKRHLRNKTASMVMLKHRKTFKITYAVLYLYQLAVVWLWLSWEYYANRFNNFWEKKKRSKKIRRKKNNLIKLFCKATSRFMWVIKVKAGHVRRKMLIKYLKSITNRHSNKTEKYEWFFVRVNKSK